MEFYRAGDKELKQWVIYSLFWYLESNLQWVIYYFSEIQWEGMSNLLPILIVNEQNE